MITIDKFIDGTATLSPSYPVNAVWENKAYPTIRHAIHVLRYQGSEETKIAKMTIEDLNNIEASLKPKRYWDMMSTPVLYILLKDRYRRHTELRRHLYNTGEANILIKAPDTFGEQSDERLLEVYGRLLTKIRDEALAGELEP